MAQANNFQPPAANPKMRHGLQLSCAAMHVKLLVYCLLAFTIAAAAQTTDNGVTISYNDIATNVQADSKGKLLVNVSPADLRTCKQRGWISYSDMGAVGDGKADDIDAIAATHAVANAHGLSVNASNKATYYIGGKERTAIIRTHTNFGKAAFIIDDTKVQNRSAPVFLVSSTLQPFGIKGIQTLQRNQANILANLPVTCLITVTNTQVKQYIRFGLNQNDGAAQTDIFLADKNGKIDMNAPIIWDFDHITNINALPVDEDTLFITGGRFTTIANNETSEYTYYSRNITIRRSHVVVSGVEHRVEGEGEQGAPYNGFIAVSDCAYITIQNALLTGHKTYSKIGNAGKPVSMGTYDITVNRALNVAIVNCSQTNDIDDKRFWGIMASNYSKNLLYDSCTLSRFDAHKGVANATIRNSTLGHMGINAIGSGRLLIENCTIRGNSLVNLRSDYGSTWEGEFIIRNCTFIPAGGKPVSASLINGSYTGLHNFGYTCYMPERILIENLRIEDGSHPANYQGPAIFADFNPSSSDSNYKEVYPYIITKEVVLHGVTSASGKALRVSNNKILFSNVILKTD